MSEKKDTTILTDATLPKARARDIVVQKIENEVLVYDLLTKKAHHLNKTSSLVWKKCDGKTTVQELTQLLSTEAKQEIEEDFVLIALDDLNKASLLETGIDKIDFKGLSRRNVLMRYALPTLVFPAVLSLVSPTPAQTGSCLGAGQTDCCVTPCCPGLFCGNALGIACPGICVSIVE